jgi:peptidoglycan/LPS O-acetylase OafA/YrhL
MWSGGGVMNAADGLSGRGYLNWLVMNIFLDIIDTSRRENNFNLLRLAAATGVLVSHSWPLFRGGGADFLPRLLPGLTMGKISVDLFFILSGFLVTRSFMQRDRIGEFFLARALRIYPGLLVCVIFCIALGAFVTDIGIVEYFKSRQVWDYLAFNATALEVRYRLPGVFESTPFAGVNGSLWTLPVEARLYALVALIGFIGVFRHRVALSLLILLIAFGAVDADVFATKVLADNGKSLTAAMAFLLGMLLYLNRDKVVLSRLAAVLALAVMLVFWSSGLVRMLYMPILAYVGFVLALHPALYVPTVLNRSVDLSYGIYLYAFPVQQFVMWSGWAGSIASLTIISLAIVVPMACVSWFLIEHPALRWKVRRPGRSESAGDVPG